MTMHVGISFVAAVVYWMASCYSIGELRYRMCPLKPNLL